jgi:hypothetical protein
VGKVREAAHHADALLAELASDGVDIELTFEVVHAGREERLAVKLAPETDGADARARHEPFVREVPGDLFGAQIDIGEDHRQSLRMFEHLRAPTGVASGVETLATTHPERLEHADERAKPNPTRAVGVVIAVEPTEPERVLTRLLEARRAVLTLVEAPFRFEEHFARKRVAELGAGGARQLERRDEALLGRVERTRAQAKRFEVT